MGMTRFLHKATAAAAASAASLLAAKPVLAHCPLCAAATAGGVAAARILGVDDTVVGTFIGGFVVSTGLWFNKWLKRKAGRELVPFQSSIAVLLSLSLMILTLFMARLLNASDSSYLIFGVDKLLFGTLAGTLVTIAAFAVHKAIKSANNGKSWVPFQGILFTLLCLSITGAAFFFITRGG